MSPIRPARPSPPGADGPDHGGGEGAPEGVTCGKTLKGARLRVHARRAGGGPGKGEASRGNDGNFALGSYGTDIVGADPIEPPIPIWDLMPQAERAPRASAQGPLVGYEESAGCPAAGDMGADAPVAPATMPPF